MPKVTQVFDEKPKVSQVFDEKPKTSLIQDEIPRSTPTRTLAAGQYMGLPFLLTYPTATTMTDVWNW